MPGGDDDGPEPKKARLDGAEVVDVDPAAAHMGADEDGMVELPADSPEVAAVLEQAAAVQDELNKV